MATLPWSIEDEEATEREFNELECEKLVGGYYAAQAFERGPELESPLYRG